MPENIENIDYTRQHYDTKKYLILVLGTGFYQRPNNYQFDDYYQALTRAKEIAGYRGNWLNPAISQEILIIGQVIIDGYKVDKIFRRLQFVPSQITDINLL